MTTTERSVQSYADGAMWRVKNHTKAAVVALLRAPVTLWRELSYSFLGFAVMFGKWKDWVTLAQRTADIHENRALAKKQGLQFDTRVTEKRDKDAAFRQKQTLVVIGLLAILGTTLYFLYRDHPFFNTGLILVALGFVGLCDIVGRRYRPVDPEVYQPRPITPLEPGISYRKLQADIAEILEHEVKPPIRITFHGKTILEHGIEFDVHLTQKLTDDHLRVLERHLQAGRNMVSLVHNRANTAAPVLRIFWRDPLADTVVPARRAPKSLSCKDPFYLTRDDTGNRPPFNVLGVHQFWTGQSGSGKSSAIWTLLDWLVDCKDADVYGIDVAGTVFAPYRRVLAGHAENEEDAIDILDAAIDEYHRRIELLNAGLDADEDGLVDENWVVSQNPGDRAWFIILDEYKAIAQKHEAIRERVEHLMEVGRKVRIHIIISSPAADKKSLVTTTPVNQSMTKVIFSVPFSMIAHILGVGFTDDGWRPDRFEPGTASNPADSGKCYIQSPDSPRPIVQRFDRLEPEDIRERNRDRRAFMPAPKIPEPLMILQAAFSKANNPERLSTAEILRHPLAAGWDARALAAGLKECVPAPYPAPKALWIDGRTQQGYELDGVEISIKQFKK